MFKLSQRSKDRLVGVHPDLVKVVHRALELTPVDFGITEGVRSLETQKKYVAEGRELLKTGDWFFSNGERFSQDGKDINFGVTGLSYRNYFVVIVQDEK